MSYHPSHGQPPRQERWPDATPPEGWPSYRAGDAQRGGDRADRRYRADRQGAYPESAGYRQQGGYQRGSGGSADRGYRSAVVTDPYPQTRNGHGFEGYAGYLDPGGYAEPAMSGPMLTAPDMDLRPGSWQAGQEHRREAGRRGAMVGAVSVLLGTAVVIGASTLAAAILRSPVSPIAAMGDVFADRVPAALRNAVLQHFGTHGRAVLLLGMYAAIAVVALVIGVLARRAAALGVAGIAAFTVFAAFVTVTRPVSHVSDVVAALAGGIAGVAAFLWLVRASAPPPPIAPQRHARGGTRRRSR